MIQIKICGITNKDEIDYLNILKPEYIGFVFAKSKRQISGLRAKELCCDLNKEIKTVGVFKDNSIDEILSVMNEIPLDVIQLHGNEDIQFIFSLKNNLNNSTKIWKALSISSVENIRKYVLNKGNFIIDNFLIDGDNPGSGEIFSLEKVNELFNKNNDIKLNVKGIYEQYNFFLAGGITPENVVERVTRANPIGVDVSSGVEMIDEDGNRAKSYEKMKNLIESVRKINKL